MLCLKSFVKLNKEFSVFNSDQILKFAKFDYFSKLLYYLDNFCTNISFEGSKVENTDKFTGELRLHPPDNFSLYLLESSQSPMDTIGSEIKIDSLQTEVNFSIKGESEVVLHIVDDMNTNVKYKLVIGGQENTVTYLSEITKGE